MITLQALPALFLWAVVLIRLLGLRRGWTPGILPAATLVALALTLNIDQVYLYLDALLGGRNVLNLIVHLLMGAGMTELSRLILRATGRAGGHLKALISMGAVLAVIQVALLALSDTRGSATNFTDVYGHIPTIVFYQASFFAWIGFVVGYTGLKCFRRDTSGESRSFSIGFNFVSLGCLAGVAAVGIKLLLLWTSAAAAELPYVAALYVVYRALVALTGLCFAIGFLLPSYGRIKASSAARKMRSEALDTLRPIVTRLVETPEGDRARDAANIHLTARKSATQLYRWLVFIGDVRVLDPNQLSAEEITIVEEIGRKFDLHTSRGRHAASGV